MSEAVVTAGTGFTPSPPPLMLAADSWEARLIRQARLLHSAGKPVILVLRLGDCPPNWLRTVQNGQER